MRHTYLTYKNTPSDRSLHCRVAFSTGAEPTAPHCSLYERFLIFITLVHLVYTLSIFPVVGFLILLYALIFIYTVLLGLLIVVFVFCLSIVNVPTFFLNLRSVL